MGNRVTKLSVGAVRVVRRDAMGTAVFPVSGYVPRSGKQTVLDFLKTASLLFDETAGRQPVNSNALTALWLPAAVWSWCRKAVLCQTEK